MFIVLKFISYNYSKWRQTPEQSTNDYKHFYIARSLFWSDVVRRRLSVRPSVNFSYFRLLKNHWANLNQTRHKASLGKGDSSFQG